MKKMEELEPQSLPRSVLSLVLEKFFLPGELLQLRTICREWAELIGEKICAKKIILRVDRHPESIKRFLSLHPTLKPKHFRLTHLDLTGTVPSGNVRMGVHKDVHPRLTLNHCSKLETLQLENCRMATATFLQLILECSNLKSLGVIACPSIYRSNISLLHCKLNPQSLTKSLMGVTSLTLAETSIPEKDLWGLTLEMKLLRVVHISCNDKTILPRYAIINLLDNNCGTLEQLTLGGRLFGNISYDDDVVVRLGELPKMGALRSFSLFRSHFDTLQHSFVLQDLFEKWPRLNRLQISEADLDNISFSSLEESLTELEIGQCELSQCTFVDVGLKKLRKLKVLPQKDVYTDNLEESVSLLLRNGLPMLETLQLKLVTGGQSYLKALDPLEFPRLVNLSLDGFPEILGRPLRKLFRTFPKLQSFALTNCEDLVDENLCKGADGEVEGSIGNLRELHYLSLSGTSVKNLILVECIPLMKKLECLRLDGTRVDKPSLKEFFAIIGVKNPSFRHISLTSCDNCRLSSEDIGKLKKMAPHVSIACTIEISHLMPPQ